MRSVAGLRIGIRLAWRHVIVVVVLLVVVASAANAAGRVPYGQGLLWKIEHPGVAPSYVFGTMHVNDPRVRNLPAPVRSAFNRAERTVFEVIITADVRRQLSMAKLLPDGRTLDEILGQELFGELAALAERNGIDRDTLRRLKPWAAATILQFRQAEFARAYMGELPLDQWMQSNARSRNIPVLELETAAEQIAVFESMGEANQVAMLRDGLSQDRGPVDYLETLTRRYVARDIGAIYTEFQEDIDTSGSDYARLFAEKFVDDRNRKMVDRMQDLLRQGGTFIAVGALHLPGDQGILRLLQRRGYSIVRVY